MASKHSTIREDGSVFVDKYFVRKLKGNKRIRQKKATIILHGLYYVVLASYLDSLQWIPPLEGEVSERNEEETPAA